MWRMCEGEVGVGVKRVSQKRTGAGAMTKRGERQCLPEDVALSPAIVNGCVTFRGLTRNAFLGWSLDE